MGDHFGPESATMDPGATIGDGTEYRFAPVGYRSEYLGLLTRFGADVNGAAMDNNVMF